mgnify:CR=1 FL=1
MTPLRMRKVFTLESFEMIKDIPYFSSVKTLRIPHLNRRWIKQNILFLRFKHIKKKYASTIFKCNATQLL